MNTSTIGAPLDYQSHLRDSANEHYNTLLIASGKGMGLTNEEIRYLADNAPDRLLLLGKHLQELGKELQNAID
jgi:hypothetical protein